MRYNFDYAFSLHIGSLNLNLNGSVNPYEVSDFTREDWYNLTLEGQKEEILSLVYKWIESAV